MGRMLRVEVLLNVASLRPEVVVYLAPKVVLKKRLTQPDILIFYCV